MTLRSQFTLQEVIISVIGVPGALLAGWMVELPYLGRKGTLALSSGTYPQRMLLLAIYLALSINR